MNDPDMAERLPLSSSFVCEHGPLPSGAGALSVLLKDDVPAGRYGPNTGAVIEFLRSGVIPATEADAQRIAAWYGNDPGSFLAERFEAELITVAASTGLEDAARHAYADAMVVASESLDLGMTAQDVCFARRPDGLAASYAAATGLAATAIALEQVLSPATASAIRGPRVQPVEAGPDARPAQPRRDRLTGLPIPPRDDRGHWIDPAFPLADRLHPGTAVLYLDLYRFAYINDYWGYARGDEIIRAIAVALVGVAGERPVWRVGGDEFLVVADGGGRPALELARALRAAVQAVGGGAPGHPVDVTIGIGVAREETPWTRSYGSPIARWRRPSIVELGSSWPMIDYATRSMSGASAGGCTRYGRRRSASAPTRLGSGE